jgi:adenosylhomocysteine nucleosidase
MNFSGKFILLAVSLIFFSVFLSKPCPAIAQTGIIVALTGTSDQIRSKMNVNQIKHFAKRAFIEGKLSGTDIVMVRSPMGMINNAITTQLLITQFNVKRIISIAPAGGVADHLKIGDLVIASEVWQHDFGTFKPYGFIWGKTPDGSGNHSLGYQQLDKNLFTIAKKTADSTSKSINHFYEGIIASGDSFIADKEKKDWIAAKFNAAAVDMGAAAIAQVCYANNIRCLILRLITDKAGINARIDFGDSLPVYRSTINVSSYISLLLDALSR